MFSRTTFAGMRRAGFSAAISKSKISEAMLDILLQLPTGTAHLKETIVRNLGLMGQLCLTRDINQAWEQTKRTAAKRYPEKFDLNDKKTLTWHSEVVAHIDKRISTSNLKKLNALAASEGCTVDALIARLIARSRGAKQPAKASA